MSEKKPPLVSVNGLHACIAVKDIDAAVAWYCDVLGFRPLQGREFPKFSSTVEYIESNGVEIELVECLNETTFVRANPPTGHVLTQGITQLSLRVKNIEEVYAEAKARGLEIAFDLVSADELKLKAFFIRDNEGNLIEFLERIQS